MKYRLLILSSFPFPGEMPRGGLTQSVSTVVNELSGMQDVDVTIVTFTNSVKSRTVTELGSVTVIYLPLPRSNYPSLVPRYIVNSQIKMEIESIKPDIINIQGISKYYLYPLLNADNITTVLTVHGIIHQESRHWMGLLGRIRGIVGRRLESVTIHKAKHLIAVSNYVEKYLISHNKTDIYTLYNPVDSSYFKVDKKVVKNRILFVGGIEERKGLDFLVESLEIVVKSIPTLELNIVGSVRKQRYYLDLIKKINRLNLQNNVNFLGGISKDDLLNEYSEAELFILPSKEESMGIVLAEAMATGTPLIATRVGGIPDIISHGINGLLVDYGNINEMAELIEGLLSNPVAAESISVSAKIESKKYSPDRIAELYLCIHDEIFYNSEFKDTCHSKQ